MKKRALLIVLAAYFALTGLQGVANAADKYDFVRIRGLAHQWVGEQLMTEVYKRAGLELSVTEMPGKRALAESTSGRRDGEVIRIFDLGENEKRLVRAPTSFSNLETSVFVHKDKGVKITSVDDLKNYKVAIVTGVLHTHAVADGLPNVIEVKSPENMFKLVQSGRADVALSSRIDGLVDLSKLGITDVVYQAPPLVSRDLHHYVHTSKADEVIAKIDPIMKEMVASGEMAELRKKFEAEAIANAAN